MASAQNNPDIERLIKHLGELPEPVAEPVFIVVSGLPGTGKSYFSKMLAERLPLVILESDDLRKTLFSRPDYGKEESAYLFKVCHSLIELLLSKGISTILDATNLSERNREYLYSISDRLEIKMIIVRTIAPREVVQERLRVRAGLPANRSDADWAVYQKMESEEQRITRNHYVVDTSRDIKLAIDKIIRDINRKRRN
jgi:predicted kinase